MADERYVNQTQLASKKGVTRQAIRKAAKEGKIKIAGTGRAARIDLQDPATVAYLAAPPTPGKSPAPPPAKPKVKRTGKKAASPLPKPDAPVSEEKNIPPPEATNEAAVEAYADSQQLKRLKIEEELEKLRLKNRETRGELIKRETVQEFMHRLHEIDNGHWKTLGLKISSDVAAKLEIDDDALVRQVCDVIEREVLAVLKQVKREQNKFLKKIGAQKIETENKKGKAVKCKH